jgi:peptidoglycan/xylan/chitin deacetylase (PgdA/CDA1 family)
MAIKLTARPARTGRRDGGLGTLGRVLRAVFVAAVVATLGVTLAPPAQAADTSPYRATVFTRGYDTGKVVTLTFDSAYGAASIPGVLNVLRANGITAAFALTGEWIVANPSATRSIAAAGHKLINHSYSHPHFPLLTQAQRWAQLDRTETALRNLGLTSAGWFRTPYRDGYVDSGINRDLALRGYYLNVDWTYDTLGWKGSSRSVILDRVRRLTVPGSIILMHVGTGSTDPAALPYIISTLRGMGYGFTTPYTTLTRGSIRTKYVALGERNFLGAPRTGQMLATTTGTAVQWFERGRIYWHSTLGAYTVHGTILTKYRALGTVTSILGFPTRDLRVTADGVGRYSHFQYGSIFWSPSTGAREVHGAIRAKWASLGWERGFLRYPVSDEVAVTGGRASRFQGGNIYWSATTRAHELHGALLTRYISLGGSGSRLGLPITDVYSTGTGWRSDFQHGSIIWSSATGTTTVIYR